MPKKNFFNLFFLFFIPQIIYLLFLPPTISIEDSPQFSLTAYLLGISQPTGYPLYNLVGKLFSYLPVGDIGFRINFYGMFFSLLAITGFFIFCLFFLQKDIAFIISLVFSFSYFFWFNLQIAKIYSLNYFLFLILFTLFFSLIKKFNLKYFYLYLFLSGITLTNHFTALFFLALILFFIKKNFKVLLSIFFFFLPLTIYLYLPLRAASNPFLNWGDPQNLKNFFLVITKAQWLKDFINYPVLIKIFYKFAGIIFYLSINFTIFFIPLILSGILITYKKKLFKILTLFFIGYIIFLIIFADAPKDQILRGDFLLLPLFFLSAIFIGKSLEVLFKPIKLKYFFAIGLVLIIFITNLKEMEQFNNYKVKNYGLAMLNNLPKNSILFCENVQQAFIGWYLQGVENKRKDIIVVANDFLPFKWGTYQLKQNGLQVKNLSQDNIFHFHGGKKVKLIVNVIIKNNPKFNFYLNKDGGDRTIKRNKFPFKLNFYTSPEKPNLITLK